jgi:hypothetical protein
MNLIMALLEKHILCISDRRHNNSTHRYVVVQGPLAGWTQKLVRAMTTAGKALKTEGYASMGEFIVDCMKDITAGGKPALGAVLTAELVRIRSFCVL